MNKSKVMAAIAVALGVAGCTGVTSLKPKPGATSPSGLAYSPPSSLIPISIDAGPNGMTVSAAALQYIPDERHRYLLRPVFSPFNQTDAKFEVSNGLLSSVKLESTGRLTEAAAAAAKSLALFESNRNAPVNVFSDKIRVDRLLTEEIGSDGRTALGVLEDKIRGNLRSKLGIQAKSFSMSVRREFPSAAVADAASADCSVGFCYRTMVSYILEFTYDGQTQTARVMAPNDSPIYAARVDQGLFAKWTTNAVLSNGVLTTYEQKVDGSEAEGLFGLPSAIVAAQIEGLAQKGELLQSRFDLEEKQIDLEKKRKELNAPAGSDATPESDRGGGGFLFQLTFGEGVGASGNGADEIDSTPRTRRGVSSNGERSTTGSHGSGASGG